MQYRLIRRKSAKAAQKHMEHDKPCVRDTVESRWVGSFAIYAVSRHSPTPPSRGGVGDLSVVIQVVFFNEPARCASPFFLTLDFLFGFLPRRLLRNIQARREAGLHLVSMHPGGAHHDASARLVSPLHSYLRREGHEDHEFAAWRHDVYMPSIKRWPRRIPNGAA
jgi:hypothetical protein